MHSGTDEEASFCLLSVELYMGLWEGIFYVFLSTSLSYHRDFWVDGGLDVFSLYDLFPKFQSSREKVLLLLPESPHLCPWILQSFLRSFYPWLSFLRLSCLVPSADLFNDPPINRTCFRSMWYLWTVFSPRNFFVSRCQIRDWRRSLSAAAAILYFCNLSSQLSHDPPQSVKNEKQFSLKTHSGSHGNKQRVCSN